MHIRTESDFIIKIRRCLILYNFEIEHRRMQPTPTLHGEPSRYPQFIRHAVKFAYTPNEPQTATLDHLNTFSIEPCQKSTINNIAVIEMGQNPCITNSLFQTLWQYVSMWKQHF
ncbi:hypothetical protein WA026_016627 [Henosepilachna vigintioctopunctata]|uniref:Uncharacterized protein n=1 Tax=Henosepilachna vigintioctopunctata TaxID=420089 RepID=A0AAW1VGK2_9CUCU